MRILGYCLCLVVMSSMYAQFRVDTLLIKTKFYLRRNPDSSIYYLNHIKRIADESGSDSLRTAYHTNRGVVSYYKGDYDSAIFFWKKVLTYQGVNHPFFHSFASNNIGTVYTFQSKNDSAIIYLQKAVLLKEELNEPSVGNTYNNLGEVNLKLGFIEKAKEYFELGLKKKLENGYTKTIGNSFLNLGRAYHRLYDYDSSIYYTRKALQAFTEVDDKKGIADACNNLGNYFIKTNKDSAVYYLGESSKLKLALNNRGGLIADYLSLSKLYIQQEEWDQAKNSLNSARPLIEEMQLPARMVHLLQLEIAIDSARNQWFSAFMKMKTHQMLLDSIYDIEMAATTKELEARFETNQKEKEIALLAEQNKSKDLELEKRRQFQLLSTIIAVLIVVCSLIFIYLARQKSKYREASLQNEINQLRAEIQAQVVIQNKKFDTPLDELNNQFKTPLSEREYEVLQKIFTDKTNREIAEELYVSVNTIKTHLKNLYKKLEVTNREDAFRKIVTSQ